MSVPIQVLRDSGAQEPESPVSTVVTVLSVIVSGGNAGVVFLKSTIISTVLSMFNSGLLRLHQTASSLTSCL